MNTGKSKTSDDFTTESKIMNAARNVFHKKGFAAARTRDIAEEAGINLALLNYYFRSKEKLFNLVMFETVQTFFESITHIFNDPDTSLDEKIEKFAADYIDLLISEPEIPLFILSEIRNNPEELLQKIDIRNKVFESVFALQFEQGVEDGRIKSTNFIHFMMNTLGLIVFPVVASPMLKAIGGINDETFNQLLADRKKLIPVWIKAILYQKVESK